MIRFAALVAAGAPSPAALAAYDAQVSPEDAAAARALLAGTRPKRIAPAASLLDWVAEATGTPAFLTLASLAVTPDKAEVAALLLPAATGTPPTLTEALTQMRDRDSYLTLARRLPPEARLVLNRIAAGTFRSRLAASPALSGLPGTCLAILTMIDPAGPEATFALPHGNSLIPLTKLRLTLPEAPQILTWVRANTTDRFGPLRQVTPTLVFEIGHDGTTPNPRRKSGLDLIAPRLTAWHRDLTPDSATPLATLKP